MPQRQRIDLADVAAWPNLEAALWQAARGKRSRPDVAAFLADAPARLAEVQAALLAGHASAPGRGLPIGSLTSQHLANQFLGELDRAALAHPACLRHARYMDDIVLWCAGRAQAQALLAALQAAVAVLGLQFKPPRMQPVARGLRLCGFRLGPQGLRFGLRRQRAWRAAWLQARWRWQQGLDDDAAHLRA